MRVAVRITVQGKAGTPGVVQVLVEDERGAFLFDCGVASGCRFGLPSRIDGVLISHAHPQHTAGIAQPAVLTTHIYASVMTAAILKAKQDISPGPEHEYVYEAEFAIRDGRYTRLQTYPGRRCNDPTRFS